MGCFSKARVSNIRPGGLRKCLWSNSTASYLWMVLVRWVLGPGWRTSPSVSSDRRYFTHSMFSGSSSVSNLTALTYHLLYFLSSLLVYPSPAVCPSHCSLSSSASSSPPTSSTSPRHSPPGRFYLHSTKSQQHFPQGALLTVGNKISLI